MDHRRSFSSIGSGLSSSSSSTNPGGGGSGGSGGSGGEDLNDNPFFRSLQRDFAALYRTASSNCYTILVPRRGSIEGALAKPLFECHILKPSPFYQGEYLTLSEGRSVRMDDATVACTVESGFPEGRVARLLDEELFYNKDYQRFKVILIDKPLLGPYRDVSASNGWTFCRRSLDEDVRFLMHELSAGSLLQRVDVLLADFNKNYMILPGVLHFCSEKVQSIYQEAWRVFADDRVMGDLMKEPKMKYEVDHALENYVHGKVYDKVFSHVLKAYGKEDAFLGDRCARIRSRNASGLAAFGVRQEFREEALLKPAVEKISGLASCKTAIDKLMCIHDTIGQITEAFDRHASQLRQLLPNKDWALTADELIPILSYVIHLSEARDSLASNLFYVSKFQFNLEASSGEGYSLATFTAAVEFLKHDTFNRFSAPASTPVGSSSSLGSLLSLSDVSSSSETKRSSTSSSSLSSSASTGAAATTTTMAAGSSRPRTMAQAPQVISPRSSSSGSNLGNFLNGLKASSSAESSYY